MATLNYPALGEAAVALAADLEHLSGSDEAAPEIIGSIHRPSGLLLRYLRQRRREWKQSLLAGALASASISGWLYLITQLS